MTNTDTPSLEMFINADGGLSVVKAGVLTAVPIGAATARTIIAIWSYGRRREASCSDQYAAQALEALLNAMPNVSTEPLAALTARDDPRTRRWTATFSGPRTRTYL
jgi:hypothetical protein